MSSHFRAKQTGFRWTSSSWQSIKMLVTLPSQRHGWKNVPVYMVTGKSLYLFLDDQKAGGGNTMTSVTSNSCLCPYTSFTCQGNSHKYLFWLCDAKANTDKTTQVAWMLKTVQQFQKLPLNLVMGVFNHCRPEKALCNLCNQHKLYLRCGLVILFSYFS